MKHKIDWKALIISFFTVAIVAFLGSVFTSPNTKSEWYLQNKPSITPPNYIFPVAWNILFILIAISLYLLWVNSDKAGKRKVVLVFGLNFVLNVLWSALFFGLRNPLLGFVDIILLWITILKVLTLSWKTSKTAFYMLIPYFVWVSFASILNLLFLV